VIKSGQVETRRCAHSVVILVIGISECLVSLSYSELTVSSSSSRFVMAYLPSHLDLQLRAPSLEVETHPIPPQFLSSNLHSGRLETSARSSRHG